MINEGRGQCVTKFIHLLQLKDGIAKSMYDAVRTILPWMDLSLMNLVGFGSNSSLFILHIWQMKEEKNV